MIVGQTEAQTPEKGQQNSVTSDTSDHPSQPEEVSQSTVELEQYLVHI